MERIASPLRTKQIVCAVLNIAMVIMEFIGISICIYNNGLSCFQYYTQDSNLFAMFACLLCVFYTLRNLRRGVNALPSWVKLIRYMSSCCLTVTLLVVLFVLIPTLKELTPSQLLFKGSSLYHHTLCPIVSLVAFIFFEGEPKLTKKHALIALIPTLLYAIVTATLNVLRIMDGPYPFLHVYEQPFYVSVIWFILIVGGAYLLALLLKYLNTRYAIKKL